ncbi:MAG TPA: hypothetical protein ENJ32_01230 [Crenotrichaceae bacterium]|nr:hypothetical protein [Crenotrichaceae bacterium]
MTEILSNITYLLNAQITQHRNKPFLKAAMAACALVASANGKVTLYQRMKLDQILETQNRLAIFDPHDGINLFNEYAERLQNDSHSTRKQLYETIKSTIDCEQTANCLIQMSQTLVQNNHQTRDVQFEINALCEIMGAQSEYHGVLEERQQAKRFS